MKKIMNFLGPKGISLLLIFCILIIFLLQNSRVINISFLFWDIIEFSMPIFIIVTYLLGLISGVILTILFKLKFQDKDNA